MPEHTQKISDLKASANQYSAPLSPFSYKNVILIQGDDRSSQNLLLSPVIVEMPLGIFLKKTMVVHFLETSWQLAQLPRRPETVCVGCL